MKSAIRWMFYGPIALIIALLLGGHNPYFISPDNWSTLLAAAQGGPIWSSISFAIKNLKDAEVISPLEIKIFNEQIKLMAVTVNAMALAILAAALVQPLLQNFEFGIKNAVLLALGLFVHSRSYYILAMMRPEPIK